ncbi:alpha/beta fold hydrolase, partial [Bordetella pertussis]
LAGTADPIVPPALTRAQFGACAGLHWRDGGGHLLPASDPDWCAGRIRAFLAGLPA